MQMVQSVQLFERPEGMAFSRDILKCTDEDGGYFLCRMAFHVRKVMLHNVQTWGFEYPKQSSSLHRASVVSKHFYCSNWCTLLKS